MCSRRRPVTDLSGQVAVVTGIAGRLGRVWAAALCAAGARVFGIDVPPTDWSALYKGLAPYCGEAGLLLGPADVTYRPFVADKLTDCRTLYGPPSILVNSAGIDQPPGSDAADPTELLRVNVAGVLNCIDVFGAEMARYERGSIINIGSLYGSVAPNPALYAHLGWHKPPAYGASKAAVHALTRHYAALWGPRGVRVNTLSPGGVRGGQDATFVAEYERRVPMGRMAEPEDLTGPLLFLAGDASRYVTGQELIVDGGYTAW